MTSRSNIGVITGASVIGSAHRCQKMPNQDAFKCRNYGYGCVMAVADGVGSDRYAHFGSKAAVQAVHEAFCTYVRGDIRRTQITKSIYEQYVLILKERYQAAASTTCMFAAYLFGQGLYLGMIGDGIICGSINSQPFVMQKGSDSFTNIVSPLSTQRPNPVWTTKFISEKKLCSIRLMLATDGVSEDILPNKEADFAGYLMDSVHAQKLEDRQRKLLNLLENWETPKSLDDKTIVLYQHFRNEAEVGLYG